MGHHVNLWLSIRGQGTYYPGTDNDSPLGTGRGKWEETCGVINPIHFPAFLHCLVLIRVFVEASILASWHTQSVGQIFNTFLVKLHVFICE